MKEILLFCRITVELDRGTQVRMAVQSLDCQRVPVDRRGPPVSANKAEKQGPHGPRKSLEILQCGPLNKKF